MEGGSNAPRSDSSGISSDVVPVSVVGVFESSELGSVRRTLTLRRGILPALVTSNQIRPLICDELEIVPAFRGRLQCRSL